MRPIDKARQNTPLTSRMSRQVFLALVNPKSGGQMGSNLLARFKEILDEERVHDLTDGGPEKALRAHLGRENLRIIGEREAFLSLSCMYLELKVRVLYANFYSDVINLIPPLKWVIYDGGRMISRRQSSEITTILDNC